MLRQLRTSKQYFIGSCKYSCMIITLLLFLLQSCSETPTPQSKDLFEASSSGDVESMKVLLIKGADVNAKNSKGETPLHLAVVSCNNEAIEMLISKGANIDQGDYNGDTPLHWAATKTGIGICELLILKGANVNAKNNDGRTPLSLAASLINRTDICEFLISKGADINAKDLSGLTPLDWANNGNQKQTYNMLLGKGALEQKKSPTSKKNPQKKISRNAIMSPFQELGFSFLRGDPMNGKSNMVGQSPDGYSLIQIIGSAENVEEVSISGVIPDEDNRQISDAHALYYALLPLIITPQWDGALNWIVQAKERAFQRDKDTYEQTANIDNFQITIMFNKPLGIMMISFHRK